MTTNQHTEFEPLSLLVPTEESMTIQTGSLTSALTNPLQQAKGTTCRNTHDSPVRATRTRKYTEQLRARLDKQQPGRHHTQISRTRGHEAVSAHLLALLPDGIEADRLTMQHGWDIYLALERGNGRPGTNADRSKSDLGNKRRALMDLAWRNRKRGA